jgi:hypothetical protein
MKLVVDHFCEITSLLAPWTDQQFYSLDQVTVDPDTVYVIGREQCRTQPELVRAMCDQAQVVFSNPAEGSETFLGHLQQYGLMDLALQHKLKCIVGGDIGSEFQSIKYNHFLAQVFCYQENSNAANRIDEIFEKKLKPHSFLFLNGRARWHRTWLIDELTNAGALDSALWTCLQGNDIKYLPARYEVEQFAHNVDQPCSAGFVKNQLFNNLWGEIYLNPEPYIDTYFSVVTETVFAGPHSFFTEKIAKPLAQGHPFIAVANAGFYRDLHDLGFHTFDPWIDESFDAIQDPMQRLARIKDIVVDLTQSDLVKLLEQCREVCKYNQQHLRRLSQQIPRDFPAEFFQLINERP